MPLDYAKVFGSKVSHFADCQHTFTIRKKQLCYLGLIHYFSNVTIPWNVPTNAPLREGASTE